MSDPKALEIAAQTVYYDESGKKISRQEHIARVLKQKKVKVLCLWFCLLSLQTPEELEKEHYEWNVATSTKRQHKEHIDELVKVDSIDSVELQVSRTGYTQYATDKDLNRRQKEELRPDDPMYKYFLKKRQEVEEKENLEKELNNKEKDSKPTVSDFQQESTKPKYRGPLPAPNRFGILPGYRWDGISRGTGYESRRLVRMNVTKMRKQQAYLWSVADL